MRMGSGMRARSSAFTECSGPHRRFVQGSASPTHRAARTDMSCFADILSGMDNFEEGWAWQNARDYWHGFASPALHDNAAGVPEPLVGLFGDGLCGHGKERRNPAAVHACTYLEFGWYRSRAECGDAHTSWFEFLVQRLAERDHVRLGRVVDRHARPRHEPRDRCHIEDAALAPFDALDEGQRELGERADVYVDHGKLPLPVELVGRAHQAESRIIDHDLRFKSALCEGLADVARGIDASHVEAKHRGPSCAFGGNGFSDIGQSLLPPCDEHKLVAMRSKLVRKCSPDPG